MLADKQFLPLAAYPEHLVRIALERREIIQPLLNNERLTREMVRQRVLEVKARSYGTAGGRGFGPISVTSLYRWIHSFRQSGGDLRSLIPYVRHTTDATGTRLDPTIDAMIDSVLQELYWSQERVSIDLVQRTVMIRLQEVNRSLPEQDRLHPPSRTTLYRRIRAWASRQGEIDYAGLKHANPSLGQPISQRIRQLRPITALSLELEQQRPQRPNQYVECDFLRLDILVIDPEDSLLLGCPVIVLLRDRYTGYPTGCWMSFDAPTPHTILECLFSSCLEKADIRTQYNTRHDYLGFGLPEVLVLDHARGLTNPHLERICRHLSIDVQFEPVSPFSKSPIERLLSRIPHLSISTAPFNVPRQEGDTPQLTTGVRLDELWYALYHWIVDDVAQQVQYGVGEGQGVPAHLWQRACERGFVPRTLSEQTAAMLLLSRTVERRMQREGILFEHLIYKSACSVTGRAVCLPRPNTSVQITYYPDDLSRLWALDPTSQGIYELMAADQEYTAGLSLSKHRIIKQYARSHVKHDVDLAALRRAKAHIRQLISDEFHLERDSYTSHGARHGFDPRIACWMCDASPPRVQASGGKPHEPDGLAHPGSFDQEQLSWRRNAMKAHAVQQDTPLEAKKWRSMADQERFALLQRMLIQHNRLAPLISELDTLAQYADADDSGTLPCLAILGESGVGKTTLVQSWIESRTAQARVPVEGGQTSPYLYHALPSPATPKALLATCLAKLEDAAPARGAEWAMMQRLQNLIQASSVRVLFLDELQHLVNRETQRVRYACIEMLEHIIVQTGVSMVFLGSVGETEPIFQVSHRLERLVGTPRILRPFEWLQERPSTIEEFRALMRAIDRHLPFDPSGLGEEEMSYCFFYATDGIVGWIMQLIRYAAMKAIQAQEANLSRRMLAEAYEACIAHTAMGLGKINPFATPGFPERVCTRSPTRTIEKKVRKAIRYMKESDQHEQIKNT